jgi:hypothetical protein
MYRRQPLIGNSRVRFKGKRCRLIGMALSLCYRSMSGPRSGARLWVERAQYLDGLVLHECGRVANSAR